MKTKISINKQGQALGPKGHATRQRLMKAAERLLSKHSPLDLTAVAIAKEAGTSSATFYMYFDDVKDAFFALGQGASDDVVAAIESVDVNPSKLGFEVAAKALVTAFNEAWNRHRHILRYRNMEADRGDANFDKLRMSAYMKELEVISEWIQHANPRVKNKPSRGDAYALASVLHAALERLASLDPQTVKKGIGYSRFIASQARVIAQVLADSSKWGKLPIDVEGKA